jgi:hypothetical protein
MKKPSKQDETDLIKANPYLFKKLIQSKKDMLKGKGTKIPIEDTWK